MLLWINVYNELRREGTINALMFKGKCPNTSFLGFVFYELYFRDHALKR